METSYWQSKFGLKQCWILTSKLEPLKWPGKTFRDLYNVTGTYKEMGRTQTAELHHDTKNGWIRNRK
jgi:hypothetical protein